MNPATLSARQKSTPTRSSDSASDTCSPSIFEGFRNLRNWIENDGNSWEIKVQGRVQYHLRVANTPQLRRQAFRLGRNIYRTAEYISSDKNLLCTRFDSQPSTLVLLICDNNHQAVATASVVNDEATYGLPVDETFSEEADSLRNEGKHLAELVRFAIAPSIRLTHSRELLIHLLNFSYIYAKHVLKNDGFLVTVNPSHVLFYERLLGHRRLGATKPCHKVQGAPAALMYLCFKYATARHRREAGRLTQTVQKRSLYPSLFIEEAEPFIAAYLQYRLHPMSAVESVELGLETH